mgnify:CR=1 FL=1
MVVPDVEVVVASATVLPAVEPTEQYVVAADSVQAGIGDMVLYATGSSARQRS